MADLRVKELCKEKGFTQKMLAEKIGVAEISLSRSINGNPSLDTLNKIASALGVSIAELFEQPKKNTASLTCPHCGKSIEIGVKS